MGCAVRHDHRSSGRAYSEWLSRHGASLLFPRQEVTLANILLNGLTKNGVEESSEYQLGVARRRPSRTLAEATFDPALRKAVEAYTPYALDYGAVMIGTLAFNFYAKPRFATSAEFLVPRPPTYLPDGFSASCAGHFVHRAIGAELRFVVPGLAMIPRAIADRIMATAITCDGIPVASREGMVVLSLHGADEPRWRSQRLADVMAILAEQHVDLSGWGITDAHQRDVTDCRTRANMPDTMKVTPLSSEVEPNS